MTGGSQVDPHPAMTCASCDHWEQYSSHEGVGLGVCHLLDGINEGAWCMPDAGADSGTIGTTADFGCNRWKSAARTPEASVRNERRRR